MLIRSHLNGVLNRCSNVMKSSQALQDSLKIISTSSFSRTTIRFTSRKKDARHYKMNLAEYEDSILGMLQ